MQSLDERFKEGERVFVSHSKTGTYSTHCISEGKDVRHLPSHISFEAGVSCGVPCLTGHRALVHRGELQPGQVVLIHGATGSVGLVTCQMAKDMGAFVIGTAGMKEALPLVKDNGANVALLHNDSGLVDEVMKVPAVMERGGVDLVVEMAADRNLASCDVKVMRKGTTTSFWTHTRTHI